ncbi:LacI family DNA-binding transcriptional regulator [Candidatus Izemoplasma sp. B36]|uniref:LacI family DNA-binding transcriptional regulator n=1 Tax=Candidatus Izemoplasma sp. B36 TaxID=3242468 RepID=UPI003557B8A1
MATIKDVAKMAHVSVATVSRVINQKGYVNSETKQLVLDAIKELNYVPNELARSLFQKKSSIIAVIVPHLTSYYFAELLEYIENYTVNLDYRLMVCNSQDDPDKESKYLKIFDQYNIDGIILISNTHRIDDYKKLNIPIVEIDHKLAEDIPSIQSNNFLGGKLAAQKLVNNGCKKIIHFRGPSDLVTVQERTKGFKSVLEKNQIFNFSYDLDFRAPSASDIDNVIKSNLDCDGVFCDSDYIAILAIQAIKDAGKRIPEDIQVIGFDDIEIADVLRPRLTTIAQSRKEMGEYAVTALMKLIHKEKLEPFDRNIDVKLIERDTTI